MKLFLFVVFSCTTATCFAQNDRVNDFNNTNWLQTFATINLNKKWSIHVEYQWRRTDGVKYWQQGLFRTGVNYKLTDNVILHAGYAEAETFKYGDFPIAPNGTFPEHRLYEQMVLRQPLNKFLITHRFRIEQRWLGRVKAGTHREIEDWIFLHRFRYQFRTQLALNKKWYAAAADEIFIGAGKNVGVNIFDQNRIFLLAGVKLNKNISVEGGYFNQTLQQGRRINNSTIMQRNNGVVLSTFLSF
jgi:Protein of unknown function (DUF2490)